MQSSHPYLSASKYTSEKASQADLKFFVDNPSERYRVRADRIGHLMILRNNGAVIDYLSVKVSDASGYEAFNAVWKAKKAAEAAPEMWWQENVQRGHCSERVKPEPNFLSLAEIARLKPGMRVSHTFTDAGIKPVVDWGDKPIDLNERRREKAARTTDLAPAPPEAAAVFVPTPFDWTDGSDIDPRAWLYDRHLIRKFVSGTISKGGTGKSGLKVAEALSMVTGRGLLTGKDIKPLRVWYWNGEDPEDETRRRVAAACKHYGISRGQIGGRLFLNSGRDTKIVIAKESKGGLVIQHPVCEALISAIKANRIDVFIVDPFVSSHQVSENDNSKINDVINEFREIADATNCAIELVHHSRKTGGAEVTAEDSRGGGALVDAFRSARVLNHMSEDEARKNLIDPGECRQFFRMDDGKVNMTRYGSAKRWFTFESVLLENSRPGLAQDDIGVVTTWTRPKASEGLASDALQKAIAALGDSKWRENMQSKDWVGVPIGQALGLDPEHAGEKRRINSVIKEWIAAAYLDVFESLDKNGDIRKFVRPALTIRT